MGKMSLKGTIKTVGTYVNWAQLHFNCSQSNIRYVYIYIYILFSADGHFYLCEIFIRLHCLTLHTRFIYYNGPFSERNGRGAKKR